MSNSTLTNANVSFSPDPSWDWDGWNGELELNPQDLKVSSDSGIVGVEGDLIALGQKLVGKKYKAKGFDDLPGGVTSGTVMVTKSSLSNLVLIAGKNVAHEKTEGKFIVMVTPSFMKSKPPIPDPIVVKNGTWKIKTPGQSLTTST